MEDNDISGCKFGALRCKHLLLFQRAVVETGRPLCSQVNWVSHRRTYKGVQHLDIDCLLPQPLCITNTGAKHSPILSPIDHR